MTKLLIEKERKKNIILEQEIIAKENNIANLEKRNKIIVELNLVLQKKIGGTKYQKGTKTQGRKRKMDDYSEHLDIAKKVKLIDDNTIYVLSDIRNGNEKGTQLKKNRLNKIYRCSVCHLPGHNMRAHPIKPKDNGEVVPAEKNLVCPQCDFSSTNEKEFWNHVSSVHVKNSTGKRAYFPKSSKKNIVSNPLYEIPRPLSELYIEKEPLQPCLGKGVITIEDFDDLNGAGPSNKRKCDDDDKNINLKKKLKSKGCLET